jgi:hypothetical protein
MAKKEGEERGRRTAESELREDNTYENKNNE